MKGRRVKDLARVSLSNVDKKTNEDDQNVLLCNYLDVYNNDRITSDLPFMAATATADQVRRFTLHQGDVLITKDSETPDDIAVPAYVAEDLPGVVCGYHLALLRPLAGVEGRYLFWALSSRPARSQFSVSANGITRFGLRLDSFGEVRIPLPPLQSQSAIADFLDAEAARIDTLIIRKRRMMSLLEERVWSASSVLGEATEDRAPLRRYVIDACDGPFGSALKSEHYTDEGARVIRLGNVGRARWRDDDAAYISLDYWRTLASHSAQEGDLVVAGLGDEGNPVGRSCVVPSIGYAMVKADCYRLRIDTSIADPQFLAWYLSSPEGLAQSEQRAEGATRPRLTLSKALSLSVPWLSLDEQVRLAGCIDEAATYAREASVVLTKQIALLNKRRQALISAAVTGELEVPGVAA